MQLVGEGLTKELKPVCDVSDPRADVCEIDGEVWIQGSTSSSVFYYAPYANDSWIIRPYARKQDIAAMNRVKEVLVKPSVTHEGPHQCNVNHSVAAIVFSMSGYTGNFFHDFMDVIIPSSSCHNNTMVKSNSSSISQASSAGISYISGLSPMR